MGGEKLLTIDGVGQVRLKKSSRSKRVRITVRPASPVSVTMPRWVSYRDAEAFLNEKLEWVKQQLVRVQRFELRRDALEDAVSGLDRAAAKKTLGARLDGLASAYGYRYAKLTLRNQKTRWGSCSAKDGISLNLKLLLLPDDLRDYVLLHELVHTKHKNHSPSFWGELCRHMPDARARQKRLREFQPG